MKKLLSIILALLMTVSLIHVALLEETAARVENEAAAGFLAEETAAAESGAKTASSAPVRQTEESPAADSAAQANSDTLSPAQMEEAEEDAEGEPECICTEELLCCEVAALAEKGELPEDTPICPVCLSEVDGKLQCTGHCEKCEAILLKRRAAAAEAGTEETIQTGAEIGTEENNTAPDSSAAAEQDKAAGETTDSAANAPDAKAAGENADSDKSADEAAKGETSAEETTENATDETAAASSETTAAGSLAASTARPAGDGKKSSGRLGGKSAGAAKGGAGKSRAVKAAGTGKHAGMNAEKSAAAGPEDYSYVAYHGIEELLLGLQAENSEIYVGEDFVLSNLGEALLISSNADYSTALAEDAQSKLLLLETPTKNGGKEILLYQSGKTDKREGSYAVSDATEETPKPGAALEEGVAARILLMTDALCIQTAQKIYYISRDQEALDSMDAANSAVPVVKLLWSSKGTEAQSEVLKLNLQSENNTKK